LAWGEPKTLSASQTTTLPTNTAADHRRNLKNNRAVHAATRHPAATAAERRSTWLNMTVAPQRIARRLTDGFVDHVRGKKEDLPNQMGKAVAAAPATRLGIVAPIPV
jgi:hypothetical protein